MNITTVIAAICLAVGAAGGVGITRNYCIAHIEKSEKSALADKLTIANAYSDQLNEAIKQHDNDQQIVNRVLSDVERVRVRFPNVQRSDCAVPVEQAKDTNAASRALQPDVGAAFEEFRRSVESDIIRQCDQLNIDARR